MERKDKILLGLIGVLAIAVLAVEFMPVSEPASSVPVKVTYTPAAEKPISSSAVTSAYIMPDTGGAAKVSATIK